MTGPVPETVVLSAFTVNVFPVDAFSATSTDTFLPATTVVALAFN